ncbi:MAG: basic amino acid/polyamine antiporter [Lamprobacter sp.]|uniref:basic amino acid/polyamine antiporter n=1 Tax=Lamprobacter sp. TaxID=3100796 RepID=UPI002B25AB13|nr:basic amino acid/polyamine antiporter [Lamprobacter sp.]MEA3640650.1 basic amino acid/polyamine antiporter [Lamprobacter sp.]
MADADAQKFSRLTLTAMVVGSMIGAGIFSLPARFGAATGPFGAIVAWIIAGGGMLMLAFVFQSLAVRKPEIDAGIFAYAKEGFGHYLGFAAAFGFWIGTCLGNTTYFVLIKSTLGAFFPVFGDGNTPQAVIVSSIVLWSFHFMILRGIKEAAFINKVVTVAKILPIFVFIAFMIFAFDYDLFASSFWGGGDYSGAQVFDQVRSTMLVTVFVFIGIEGASVYSRYAKRREDVGWATVMGFVGVLCLLVLVTLLPYGVLERPELAELRQPSMAGTLQAVVGDWGLKFVSVGLIVSVLGAFLAWSLLAAEVLYSAAKYGLVPKVFAHENKHQVPSAALWITNILVQLFLIVSIFSQYAFDLSLEMTSALTLIPYTLVAGYALKLVLTRETYGPGSKGWGTDMTWALIATVYTIFMLLSGGLKHLVLACILLAPGTILFVLSRREQQQRLFGAWELALFGVFVAGAAAAVYGLATGMIII